MMKRTTILILTLAIAIVAATSTSAKSSRGSIPTMKQIEKLMNKLSMANHPARVAAPAGMKLLAKRVTREVFGDDGTVVYGNNAKATINRNGIVKATATGSHAWYFVYSFATDHWFSIAFRSESDRDAFWEQFEQTDYYDTSWGLNINDYLFYEDGWYGINLEPH